MVEAAARSLVDHVRANRAQEQLDLRKREIVITAPLVKQGAVSEVELLRLERDSSRLRSELDAATLAIPRALSAIEEARKKIHDNEMQFRSQAAGELSQARNEMAKATEAVPGLEDRLARTVVRPPVNGVVQPGTPLAEIVVSEDSLLVETRIRPQDIGFVSVGQRATVKLAAYDYSIFGGLEARVEMVGADSVVPQSQAGVPGEPYYVAHVRTTKAVLDYHGKPLAVIPGMTGQVDILTGRRSVLYYLLKPLNKARERALTER